MAKTPASRDATPTPDENPTPDGTSGPGKNPRTAGPTAQTPIEQTPIGSAPRPATSAASGGATGLPLDEEPRATIFGRHPLGAGIAAGVVAVVLVSGLTAWGVGTLVTASLTSSHSTEMPMAMPTSTPMAGGHANGTATGKGAGTPTTGRLAFRATIQSMDGGSWTILTKKGKTVTVAIASTTQFGTKKATSTADSFAVGDSVIVVASDGTSGTPTATRVVKSPSGT